MQEEMPTTRITVNRDVYLQGKLTVVKYLDMESQPMKVVIEGAVQLPRYFEEIEQLETERLKITDITVYREAFGSAEEDITYSFIAGDLHVKQ